MKKTTAIALVATSMIILSCGGRAEKLCRKNSYFNGISNTNPGPWAVYKQDEGESDAAYENRINELVSKNYTCKDR